MNYVGESDSEMLSLLKDLTRHRDYIFMEDPVDLKNGDILAAVYGAHTPLEKENVLRVYLDETGGTIYRIYGPTIRKTPSVAIYPYPDEKEARKSLIRREAINSSMKTLGTIASGVFGGILLGYVVSPNPNPNNIFAIFSSPEIGWLAPVIFGGMAAISVAAYFGRKKNEYIYMDSKKFLEKYGIGDFEKLINKLESIGMDDYKTITVSDLKF